MCSGRELLKYFWYVYGSWILFYLLKITKYRGNMNLWFLLFTSKISRWKRTEFGHTLSPTPDFEKRLYTCRSGQSKKDHEFLKKLLCTNWHTGCTCLFHVPRIKYVAEMRFSILLLEIFTESCVLFSIRYSTTREQVDLRLYPSWVFLIICELKLFTAYRPHSHLRYATAT